ncbi:hypothetical protein DUNSADRAFT_7639 [Dunaliella salina]|uniref:Uncharacterized protein n=1 Tax=Dunaliella salina TaxID=3046 RepID=A0ABQ7FTB2_DUNSA|nr:hypothetical protein DUNSADRAFT_7639 [Dunaliella salina]|eukprot:KAF5825678.1 hypothetical protein DUNSADRAFT_7639 [Dunaliella salina]
MGKRKRAEEKKGRKKHCKTQELSTIAGVGGVLARSRLAPSRKRPQDKPDDDGERSSSEEQTDSGDKDYAQDEEESSDDEVEYGRQVCDPPGPPVPPADRHADSQGPVSRKEMRTVLRVCQKTQDLSKKLDRLSLQVEDGEVAKPVVTLSQVAFASAKIQKRLSDGSDRALCEPDYDLFLAEGQRIMAEARDCNYKEVDGCIFLPWLTIVLSLYCCKLIQVKVRGCFPLHFFFHIG